MSTSLQRDLVMAERAYSAPFTPGDSPGATPAKRRGPRPPYRTREEQDAATQAAAPPATPATPATEEDSFADAIARIDRIQQRAKDSAVLRSTSRAGKQHTEVVRLSPGLPRPIAPGGTEIAPDTETLAAATESMDVLAKASASIKGASPEDMVALLEELQRNPQLQQLAKSGIMSWDSLTKPNDGSVALPDGSRPERVIDYEKLLKLQQQLSVLAAKEAGALRNAVEVVVEQRTTPGPKAAVAGAFYPGLKVWMPPQSLPPRRPGGR